MRLIGVGVLLQVVRGSWASGGINWRFQAGTSAVKSMHGPWDRLQPYEIMATIIRASLAN